jgi:hypothetical protein
MTLQDQPPPGKNVYPALAYPHSHLVALSTGAEWGHCYENSYRAFFAYPELFYPDGTFVEGWVLFRDGRRVVLMEHSWLVYGVRIIDPTLVLVILPDQEVFYFPGVIRTWEETDKLENEFFPHVRFDVYGDDGMGHPDYKSAYMRAKERAQAMISGEQEFVEIRAGDPPVAVEPDKTDAPGAVVIIALKGDEPDTYTLRLQEEDRSI